MSTTTEARGRTVRLGAKSYPLILPTFRDPRLHLAAVIVSIHVLGQTVLGFRVSVPQILVAIGTCAAIEVAVTLRRTGVLAWPASAMLTGSGVALIFRVLDTPPDHWTWHGWHLFAIVAGASLITKYVIRARGTHVFNPSNVGLVAAFVLLGSRRVAPLDFWWAPLGGPMVIAYLLITVGGLIITRRLGLLAMAITFWTSIGIGLGVLAASGHCFVAEWALEPVCGGHFWWVVTTSPELLIFLFFMITDPKTIPTSPRMRIVFAALVAAAATFLIAPQTTEFGAKVGLLGALAILSPVRFVMEPVPKLAARPWSRLVGATARQAPAAWFARGAVAGVVAVLMTAAVVVAGEPARTATASAAEGSTPQIHVDVDASTLPVVVISDEATASQSGIDADRAARLAVMLAEDLEVEAMALENGDAAILRAADSGDRLAEMEQAVAAGMQAAHHSFESLELGIEFTEGRQAGPSIVFEAAGVRTSSEGTSEPFATRFVMRSDGQGNWLIVESSPIE